MARMRAFAILVILILLSLQSPENLLGSVPCAPPEPEFLGVEVGTGEAIQKGLFVSSLNIDKEISEAPLLTVLHRSRMNQLPHILLLQEVGDSAESGRLLVRRLARKAGMAAVYIPGAGSDFNSGLGLALLTRLPILEARTLALQEFDLVIRSRCRSALAVDLLGPWGPLRVYNVHLDTRINAKERIQQLSAVIEHASESEGTVVVGGDLNTNNFLWLRRVIPIPFVGRQVKRLTRYMTRHDFTTPFESFELGTHEMFNLKLDWIFARGAEFLDAEIEIVGFSDHHLIWAKIGEEGPDS